MLQLIGGLAFVLLLWGVPFFIILFLVFLVPALVFIPELSLTVVVRQAISGVVSPGLLCVPLFILAGTLVAEGEGGTRLIRMVRAFLGHIPGGLAITTNASCTLFGAASGSTQATVAAIGGTMRPMLLEAGYSSSFSLGLIINSSDIAFLIPPSIGYIVYGVATQTSIGKLFIAGILPGLLVFALFSVFSFSYSKFRKVGLYPAASWSERLSAVKGAWLVSGYPIVILGGIYGGFCTPTEAAAFASLYGLIVEGIIYRALTLKKLWEVVLSTGVVTSVVFILVGAGQAFAWLLSYVEIPQMVLPHVFGAEPSALRVIVIITATYFIACMFIDPVVAIYVLSPLLAPFVAEAGVSHILLGTLVTLQAAIGSATPPFGCDIFTAMIIFRRPYLETVRETPPFIAILLIATALIILFPDIALFLPSLAFGP